VRQERAARPFVVVYPTIDAGTYRSFPHSIKIKIGIYCFDYENRPHGHRSQARAINRHNLGQPCQSPSNAIRINKYIKHIIFNTFLLNAVNRINMTNAKSLTRIAAA
jgi:hypothetical protein